MSRSGWEVRETDVDGDRCLVFENATMRVAMNVDHGGHIFEFTDLGSGVNLLYQDPRGPRDYQVGGWYELFPNAGPRCRVGEHELSRHGDIQHARWSAEVRHSGPGEIEVLMAAKSLDLPLGIRRRMRLTTDDTVLLTEEIANETTSTVHYLWGHHITFGAAMMTYDCGITIPDVEFCASGANEPEALYPAGARGRLHAFPGHGAAIDLTRFGPEPHEVMLFARQVSQPWYEVFSRSLGAVVRVEWDRAAFPALWFWMTTPGTATSPELAAFAIEPQSSVVPSLADAIAAGEAPFLAAGERRAAWLRVGLRTTPPSGPGAPAFPARMAP